MTEKRERKTSLEDDSEETVDINSFAPVNVVLNKADYEKKHKGLTVGMLKDWLERRGVPDDAVVWGLDIDTMEAKQSPRGGYTEGFKPFMRYKNRDVILGFSRRPNIEFGNDRPYCVRYVKHDPVYVEHSRFCTEGDENMLTCALAQDSDRVDFGYI